MQKHPFLRKKNFNKNMKFTIYNMKFYKSQIIYKNFSIPTYFRWMH